MCIRDSPNATADDVADDGNGKDGIPSQCQCGYWTYRRP